MSIMDLSEAERTAALRREQDKNEYLKPKVNRLIEQYRRGLVIAEELAIGIIEENNQFEEVNAAHADARHGGNASDKSYWSSRGCLGCAR